MRHFGAKLYWKNVPIEAVDDAELAIARDCTHRLFHSFTKSPPFTKIGMECADNAIEQLCAIEAECMRRGKAYRDPFAFSEF